MIDVKNYINTGDKTHYKKHYWKDFDKEQNMPLIGFRSKEHPYELKKSKECDAVPKVVVNKNTNSISLPLKLAHISIAIDESKGILELPEDWDGFGAENIVKETWENMANFLANYTIYILNNFSIIIQSPEINPCTNGSIDLVWHTKNARLLINVKKRGSTTYASYYGDLLNNEQFIKNTIPSPVIIEYLAFWMKNLA